MTTALPKGDTWNDTTQCFVLSNAQIEQCINSFIASNDIDVMKRLWGEVSSGRYTFEDTNEFVDCIFSKDALEMGKAVFLPQDSGRVRGWLHDYPDKIINQCPSMFEAWVEESSPSLLAFEISHRLKRSKPEMMQAILEGRGTTRPQQVMYECLKKDPSLWSNVSPLWLGATNSALRQAVIALGWTPKTTFRMVQSKWDHAINPDWLAIFRYPYSLCMAADAAMHVWFEEQTHKQQLAGTATPGNSAAPAQAIPNSEYFLTADPVDVALAETILNRVPMAVYLQRNPDATDIPVETRRQLKGIVDMHVVLVDLIGLVDALSQDTIPGFQATAIVDVFELPELTETMS